MNAATDSSAVDWHRRAMRRGSRLAGLAAGAAREYGIVLSCVVLCLYLSLATSSFLTQANLLNLLDQAAPLAIVAAGATVVIIAGSFDLSSGALFALCGLTAAALSSSAGVPIAIIGALALGCVLGVCNGLIVTQLRVHSFLATLATSLVFRGVGLVVAGGALVLATSEFRDVARTDILEARSAVFIAVAFVLLCGFLLAFTRFGRNIYAVGGNLEGARVAGLRVNAIQVGAFAVSGTAAALAGIIGASRVGGGQIGTGVGLEFTAITAVILGGTSIFGGEGAVWKTVVGVALLTLIGNAFNLSGIDPVYQQVVVGGLLLAAIGTDGYLRRSDRSYANVG